MNIDSITNGIVLDHISAGKAMEIYKYLKLDELKCSVAIIKNVKSKKYGKKDIVKIDTIIDLNVEVLGYIDPNITVSIIRNGVKIEKFNVALPGKLVNVIKCKNPRCITSTEQEIDQIFKLTNAETRSYRCAYCETEGKDSK